MPSPISHRPAHQLALVALTCSFLGYACGGRNLEVDDDGAIGSGGAASAPSQTATSTNAGTGGSMAQTSGQGGSEPEPEPEPNPIDCIGCVANNCPQTLSCLQDPTCVQGVGCSLSQCLSSGSPDLGCFVTCFEGDTVAAYNAFQAIRCVLEECADSCGTDGFPLP